MATTTELIETLASALGIERAVVLEHARYLHQAGGMFPTDDDTARAEPEMAAALLISLMSGLPPSKAADAVSLYGGLRLESARRGGRAIDGNWVSGEIPADDPFMSELLSWGSTFGNFLLTLIEWLNIASEVDFEILNFTMGGGLGTATAFVYFGALIEGENIIGDAKFSLAPVGGGTIPDDAPRARLDWHAVVSGEILLVLRELFTGVSDGPQEVLISRADFARLGGGGSA